MTRSACLRLLADRWEEFSNVAVSLYEDITYERAFSQAFQIQSALADGGARVVRSSEDVTSMFADKLRAISIYASQFKPSYMEGTVREAALREGGGGGRLAEAYTGSKGVCKHLANHVCRATGEVWRRFGRMYHD
jgi:hypothetical protein